MRFAVSMNLEIDSETVLAESGMKGISISIDEFEIHLFPYEGEGRSEAAVLYNNCLEEFSILNDRVAVDLYWDLCDEEGNYLEDRKLTYEQLCNGEYAWSVGSMSDIEISMKTTSSEDEDGIEIWYCSGDDTEPDASGIRIIDGEGSRDIVIRRLSF